VADDLDREAVVLVAIEAWCVHAPSMAQQVIADKPLNKLMKWTRLFPVRLR
jgi:hypothetical protein